MNDTTLLTAPITLDRRLLIGETEYQVTVFPTDDRRLDLCIVSSDGDGRVVSEISGGIAPSDLTGLTDVLGSTLAGLIAMTRPPAARVPPPPQQRDRPPNRGARWTPEDDTRLHTRFHSGASLTDLATEFGRTEGGIRARLEHLGDLPPSGRWPTPTPQPPPAE
ncbi:hypothetical protein AB0F81_42905 [Actinoplanes sp. NPDC024001]|uniref:hypothetical protein n=1 Tax=Actinoplanes sp. NPDC024001 TaxID=3154598 RepID=UPI0033E6F220